MCVYTHTRIHTYTQINTHSHIHTCTYVHMHKNRHTNTHIYIYTYMCIHMNRSILQYHYRESHDQWPSNICWKSRAFLGFFCKRTLLGKFPFVVLVWGCARKRPDTLHVVTRLNLCEDAHMLNACAPKICVCVDLCGVVTIHRLNVIFFCRKNSLKWVYKNSLLFQKRNRFKSNVYIVAAA